MDIVGRGFLAQNLGPLRHAHRDVTVLAAGVSSTGGISPADFAREAELLRQVVAHCRRRGRRLVFFSTASAGMYGSPGCSGSEDGPADPQTPYGRHKLALEAFVATSGVHHLVLRLSHLVGPQQRGHQLLPALLAQVRTGVVTVYPGACRDLIDVADVVTTIGALLDRGDLAGETVNVASGMVVAVERIVERIEAALGVTATRRYLDRPSGAHHVSIAKLARLLPDLVATTFTPDYHEILFDRYLPRRIGAPGPCPPAAARRLDLWKGLEHVG